WRRVRPHAGEVRRAALLVRRPRLSRRLRERPRHRRGRAGARRRPYRLGAARRGGWGRAPGHSGVGVPRRRRRRARRPGRGGLGGMLATIVNGLTPEIVVVTGGVAASLAALEKQILAAAAEYAFPRALAATRITIAPADKRLTVRGAAALVLYERERRAG